MESIKDLEDKLFQKLNENPYDYNIFNKLGYIYLHSDNRLKSEEFYAKSIEIEKNQFEPYISLSLICTINGRLEKSLYYLLKAREKNPDSPELNKSIEEISLAILSREGKISNSEVNELIYQAEEYLNNKSIDEGLEIYLRLNSIYPDSENIMLNLAVAFLRNGDYLLAKNYLTIVTENFHDNAMSHHYLGIINNIIDEVYLAKKNIIKSLELKPSLADAATGKYSIYQKDYNEETIEKCPITNNPNFKIINVVNQSVNSFNFNLINPVRTWVECQESGLIMANPRPDEQSLKEYSFELYLYSRKIIDADIDKFILESNAYNDRLNKIESYCKKGKLLDINSDNGIFLSNTTNRDWIASGIEENYLKFKKIKEIFSVDINNVSFNDFESKNTYNTITLWESLEKISDFISLFKKIYSLLEKKGIFAFSFHDYESSLIRTLDKNYPIWYYPDYLYIFKGSLLKKILNDIGFKVLDSQIIARKYMSNVEFYCQK